MKNSNQPTSNRGAGFVPLLCTALAANAAHAEPLEISFTGTLVEVFDDSGFTAYSGALAGDQFTVVIVYDDQPSPDETCDPDACEWVWSGAPYGGEVTPGTGPVNRSSLIIENDRVVDSIDIATVINAVIEPDIGIGAGFDLWEVSADASIPGGERYFAFLTFTLDTTLQQDTSFVAIPPTETADSVAFVLEEFSIAGEFFGIGLVDSFEIIGGGGDSDGDGVPDASDNCLDEENPDQRDTNGDNIGNACDADLNGDCSVSFADLAALKAAFFPNPYNADADFNGDGFVNFGDLALMKATFFNGSDAGPGPSGLPNACD